MAAIIRAVTQRHAEILGVLLGLYYIGWVLGGRWGTPVLGVLAAALVLGGVVLRGRSPRLSRALTATGAIPMFLAIMALEFFFYSLWTPIGILGLRPGACRGLACPRSHFQPQHECAAACCRKRCRTYGAMPRQSSDVPPHYSSGRRGRYARRDGGRIPG